MSRVHQLYHDLQQERIKSAALRLDLYRVRQDRDALKTQLDALQAHIAALSNLLEDRDVELAQYAPGQRPAQLSTECTTAAQYEALSVRRAGVDL